MVKRQINQHTYNTSVEWKNVNDKNKVLVTEYFEYISATDKAPQTKKKYFHNLQLFFVWVLKEKGNKFFAELKKRDFMSWLSFLVDKQSLSPSRVRILRSTVSGLSDFCENVLADEDEDFTKYRNLILKIPAPALTRTREKTYLTEEQVERLLNWLEDKQKWKYCLYVAISFATGARKTEVAQFKRSDFTQKNIQNGMYKTGIKRAKGRGKQGSQRNFFVAVDMVDKYLKLYLNTRNDNLDDLFVSKYGGKLQANKANTFNDWCDIFSQYLGVPVYPHCYRSSIATVLKAKNKDISKIQKLLGHKDLTTTMIYIKETDEEDIGNLFNN